MKLHTQEKFLLLGLTICALVISVGYSFAYFMSGIEGSSLSNNLSGHEAQIMTVQYDAGTSTLNFVNAYPGQSMSKDFYVIMKPTEDQNIARYTITLNIDTNTFEVCNAQNKINGNNCQEQAQELVYTLTDDTGQTYVGDITGKTGTIKLLDVVKTTDTDQTYKYNLKIELKYLNSDQNHNNHKSMTGNIDVEFTYE